VKRFLTHVHDNWRRRPRFLVLLGKGTIDFRDNWGFGDNLNTPLLAATPLGLYASDNRLADVSGDDGVPDFMVGRIPVLSNEELRDYMDKLVAYESHGLGEALFFADNPDTAGDFIADSEAMRALVPENVPTHQAYVGTLTGSEARAAIFDRLDHGVGYANYIGHGALDRFADEGLIMSSDLPLSNATTPIFASLTCTVGRFEIPGWSSLGESLVTQPAGGSVATWAPSGLSYNGQAMILNRAFIESLYNEETTTLGEAVQSALEAFAAEGELPFMLSIYNLLGDPATKLR
jgi:hypothetical protein